MDYCLITPQGWNCFTRPALLRLLDKYQKLYQVSIKYDPNWPKEKLAHVLGQVMAYRASFYRPFPGPTKGQWLTSYHIAQVMSQYEKLFPNFRFIGPLPIDFAQVSYLARELTVSSIGTCGLNDVLGVIFNLDPHDKPGSHWVGAIMDLRLGLPGRPVIGYFDSLGRCPPPRAIEDFLRVLQQWAFQCYKLTVPILCNSYRHQYGDSECGVYCLHMIYQILVGKKTFSQLCREVIPDHVMYQWRDKFFKHSNK